MGMTMTQKILADHAGLESVVPGQLNEAKLDDTLLFLSHDGRVMSPNNQGFVLQKKKSNIKLHF